MTISLVLGLLALFAPPLTPQPGPTPARAGVAYTLALRTTPDVRIGVELRVEGEAQHPALPGEVELVARGEERRDDGKDA